MNDLIFNKVRELYIMRRKSFIIQVENGSYVTTMGYLGDSLLKTHLEGKTTIGVFSGQVYTNFVCFDFDYDDMNKAELSARRLIQALKDLYYLSDDNILTSVSGGKGYHVEVFFNKPIYLKDAKNFYIDILNELDENKSNIEFRPTSTQAVKLPLSFHRKHGVRCHIVSNATFKKMSNLHILDINSIDELAFIDTLGSRIGNKELTDEMINLEKEEVVDLESVITGLSTDLDIDRVKRCMQMLNEYRLLYRGSRHNSTLLLLMYLNEEGYSREDCITIVQNVIRNTYAEHRDMIDGDTTLEHALKEVVRLHKYAVNYSIRYEGATKDGMCIYEEEIRTILGITHLTLKRVLFVLMVHSKKYANKDGVFFMTYKQMAEMGLGKNGHRLKEHIDALEVDGYVERPKSHSNKKSTYKEPNHYRLRISVSGDSKKIDIKDTELNVYSFEEVVSKLVDETEVKKIVGRYQYNNYFKKYYQTA